MYLRSHPSEPQTVQLKPTHTLTRTVSPTIGDVDESTGDADAATSTHLETTLQFLPPDLCGRLIVVTRLARHQLESSVCHCDARLRTCSTSDVGKGACESCALHSVYHVAVFVRQRTFVAKHIRSTAAIGITNHDVRSRLKSPVPGQPPQHGGRGM